MAKVTKGIAWRKGQQVRFLCVRVRHFWNASIFTRQTDSGVRHSQAQSVRPSLKTCEQDISPPRKTGSNESGARNAVIIYLFLLQLNQDRVQDTYHTRITNRADSSDDDENKETFDLDEGMTCILYYCNILY